MISDVLSEASDEITRYLRDFPGTYGDPELRERILAVQHQMDVLRAELDCPPMDEPGFELTGLLKVPRIKF